MAVFAAIDVGTNSVRLLIVEKQEKKIIHLSRNIRTTRIGEGMATSQILRKDAILRTADAIADFYREAQQASPAKIYIFATSAVRDAQNSDEFIEQVRIRIGVFPEIISGEEEAKLSFFGAAAALPSSKHTNLVVIDIGGGSTEIIYDKNEVHGVSIPIGAVRLAEKPLNPEELIRLFKHVVESVPYEKPFLVGVGGTATSLAAIALEMEKYDATKIHGFKLSLVNIANINKRLHSLTLIERKTVKGLQPDRADIIPYGVDILLTILRLFNAEEITVSESDLLEGRILLGTEGLWD